MAQSQIIITSFEDEEDAFDFEATRDGRKVGYLYCTRCGNRLNLADIAVTDRFTRPWPFWNRLLVKRLGIRKPINLRGQGIGARLVEALWSKAIAAGITEIWGSITADDLVKTAGLVDWYRRRGFVVSGPDSECLPHALHKVSLVTTENSHS